MPRILSDKRDEQKRLMGIKLRQMKKDDPDLLWKFLDSLTPQEAEEILCDSEIWARDNQHLDLSTKVPLNIWLTSRGWGKSWTAGYTIKRAVEKHGVKDILVIAVAARDFRATIAPAILDQYPSNHPNKPEWVTSKASMVWPNGAIALCIPAEAGEDAPRGLNNELLIMDECAMYGRNEGIITQALLTLRREPSVALGLTTPKASPVLIDWVNRFKKGDKGINITSGTIYENMENLSQAFRDEIITKYEGTNLGRQELLGELILTNAAALWQQAIIERNTVRPEMVPQLNAIAIGLDPQVVKRATQKGRKTDDTGIIVVGMGDDGIMYTLEGATGSYSVDQWVAKICMLHDKYSRMYKTSIVAEINILGEQMVTMAFKQVNRTDVAAKIKPVFATQSKLQRAVPYALLAQQDKIKYVEGEYLEDLSGELCTYDGTGKSPNNFDAFVWGCSDLRPPTNRVTKSFELLL